MRKDCPHGAPRTRALKTADSSTFFPAHMTFQSVGEVSKGGRDGVCFTGGIKEALKDLLGWTRTGSNVRERKVRRGTGSREMQSGGARSPRER